MSTAWEKHACGSLGERGARGGGEELRGVLAGMRVRPEEVCCAECLPHRPVRHAEGFSVSVYSAGLAGCFHKGGDTVLYRCWQAFL